MARRHQRSHSSKVATSRAVSSLAAEPTRTWEERVFKNTYVRSGKRKEVRGWAVRIQFEGTRKTFSLKAQARRTAATEARQIYQTILTHGWDAARQLQNLRRGSHRPGEQLEESRGKEETRYWKQRLIRRKYLEPLGSAAARHLSVRIGDEVTHYWFPLGTESADAAAARAVEIHRTMEAKSWAAVCSKFQREITVAIFWAVSPVAVTYTTIYTLVGKEPEKQSSASGSQQPERKVAVIEADLGIQKALSFWLDQQPGLKCVLASADVKSLLALDPAQRPDLVLFNRALPSSGTDDTMHQLKSQALDLPIFAYAVGEDIDQIFISLSGVKSGYIFRRRVPSELLEPIQGALKQEEFSAEQVARHVRQYFSNLFDAGMPVGGNPRLANLTARELEILHLLSKGSVDKEIAQALRISVWTVHSHLKKVYEKLEVHTRTEAVVKYLEK